ncbi:hypothetical protein, partial [Plasmodium yoelii yoelii]
KLNLITGNILIFDYNFFHLHIKILKTGTN